MRPSVLALACACAALLGPRDTLHPGDQPGPRVAPGASGPTRFVGPLLAAYDDQAALATTRFVDGFYRAPANEGYERCIDHVRGRLAAEGFGERPGFELSVIETALSTPAWTPRSASLELLTDDGPELLHGFDQPHEADRVMLPIHAPSADVSGRVVFELDELEEGDLLLTDAGLGGRLLRGAAKRGAAAVLSSSLNDFTVDPNGGDEHEDAILFSTVSASNKLPVAKVSPRTRSRLRALHEGGDEVRVRLRARVDWDERPLRTLVARVVGATLPDQAVALAAHVQEPGAGDNASGVGGLTEAACALARAITEGRLERPARSVVFLWGDEMRQSALWLEDTGLTPVAGISADMLGQSREATGAICLIERSPDPGALDTLAPDAHTPWGAGRVREEDLVPNGLALVARVALSDVASAVDGAWTFAENPWEGGSDHDVFLGRGIPGILIWHFTDFTYHTGLDRMERLDANELERTSVGVLAAGLAVADLRRADLERYIASDALERDLRVAAALEAGREDVAERWRAWSRGVVTWLHETCVDPE